MYSYEIIDNFLNESDFKILQKWAFSQMTTKNQNWSNYLLSDDTNSVSITQPLVYDFISSETKIKKVQKLFRKKIEDFLNLNTDKYELTPNTGNITEFNSYIYRYKYGSGILMHKDSDGKSLGKRYGISFYLNDEWKDNWGGELFIYKGGYDDSNKDSGGICNDCTVDKILKPKRNRLVIVDGYWHKVNPNLNNKIDRYAIQTFITVRKKVKHKTKPIVTKRRTL